MLVVVDVGTIIGVESAAIAFIAKLNKRTSAVIVLLILKF